MRLEVLRLQLRLELLLRLEVLRLRLRLEVLRLEVLRREVLKGGDAWRVSC